MPLYSYQCEKCRAVEDEFRHVDERDDSPLHCKVKMTRLILPSAVYADNWSYQSPIDGKEVRGKRARIEDMKRNNCRPWEGLEAEKQHAKSVRDSHDAKMDKVLEAGIAETLSHMDASKQNAIKGT